MTSLRYKNPAMNRRLKLLDKDKKERTPNEDRQKDILSRKKEHLRRLIEKELFDAED